MGTELLWGLTLLILVALAIRWDRAVAKKKALKKQQAEQPGPANSNGNEGGPPVVESFTLGWANTLISALWLPVLEKYVSNLTTERLQILLSELLVKNKAKKPWQYINSIVVEEVTFGLVPPRLQHCLAQYDPSTTRMQMAMDVHFKSSGMQAVILANVVAMGLPFSLRLKVNSLSLSGRLQLGLQLSPEPPGIKTMDYTFTQLPDLDLQFAPIGYQGLGGELSGLLVTALKSAILKGMSRKVVAPHKKTLDVQKIYRNKHVAKAGGPGGLLRVVVVGARELLPGASPAAAHSSSGAADTPQQGKHARKPSSPGDVDAYVEMRFGREVFRTPIVHNNTHDPVWNWQFDVKLPVPLSSPATGEDGIKPADAWPPQLPPMLSFRVMNAMIVGEPSPVSEAQLPLYSLNLQPNADPQPVMLNLQPAAPARATGGRGARVRAATSSTAGTSPYQGTLQLTCVWQQAIPKKDPFANMKGSMTSSSSTFNVLNLPSSVVSLKPQMASAPAEGSGMDLMLPGLSLSGPAAGIRHSRTLSTPAISSAGISDAGTEVLDAELGVGRSKRAAVFAVVRSFLTWGKKLEASQSVDSFSTGQVIDSPPTKEEGQQDDALSGAAKHARCCSAIQAGGHAPGVVVGVKAGSGQDVPVSSLTPSTALSASLSSQASNASTTVVQTSSAAQGDVVDQLPPGHAASPTAVSLSGRLVALSKSNSVQSMASCSSLTVAGPAMDEACLAVTPTQQAASDASSLTDAAASNAAAAEQRNGLAVLVSGVATAVQGTASPHRLSVSVTGAVVPRAPAPAAAPAPIPAVRGASVPASLASTSVGALASPPDQAALPAGQDQTSSMPARIQPLSTFTSGDRSTHTDSSVAASTPTPSGWQSSAGRAPGGAPSSESQVLQMLAQTVRMQGLLDEERAASSALKQQVNELQSMVGALRRIQHADGRRALVEGAVFLLHLQSSPQPYLVNVCLIESSGVLRVLGQARDGSWQRPPQDPSHQEVAKRLPPVWTPDLPLSLPSYIPLESVQQVKLGSALFPVAEGWKQGIKALLLGPQATKTASRSGQGQAAHKGDDRCMSLVLKGGTGLHLQLPAEGNGRSRDEWGRAFHNVLISGSPSLKLSAGESGPLASLKEAEGA